MSTTPTSSSTASGGLSSLGGSTPLQITGLASGLDTDQIISELMAIKQQPLTALQNQEAVIKARDSQLSTLQTSLRTVLADVQALEDPSLFDDTQQVTSSDSSRVTAATTSGAGVGGYQVNVTQLANSAQRTFTYTPPSADTTVTIDGHAQTISAGESLSAVVSAINGDPNATVYAAATDSGTVVFSSRQTGAITSPIQATTAGTAADPFTDPGGTAQYTLGQDAQYSVDGTSMTSHSNTVTNAIPGVTLTLGGVTTVTGPVTVNVSPPAPDASKVQSAIQQFVTDYNSAITAVQTQLSQVPSSSDPTQGTLYQDPQLSQLLSAMRSLMYQSGSGLPSGLASMLDLGVSTGASTGSATPSSSAIAGDLTLDTSKLQAALQSNPSGVQSVLVSWTNSFASTLAADVGPGGAVAQRIQTDGSQISNLDNQISDMQASLAEQQQQLTNQYAQLEALLSQNQSEASWLTSQIAALPGASSSS